MQDESWKANPKNRPQICSRLFTGLWAYPVAAKANNSISSQLWPDERDVACTRFADTKLSVFCRLRMQLYFLKSSSVMNLLMPSSVSLSATPHATRRHCAMLASIPWHFSHMQALGKALERNGAAVTKF
jgi:hypothetical protein